MHGRAEQGLLGNQWTTKRSSLSLPFIGIPVYYRHVCIKTVLGTKGLPTHFTVVAEMSSKVLSFNVFLEI